MSFGKMTILSFSNTLKSNEPLVIVHFDVYGPLNVKTHKCLEHFVIFSDDFSHYNYIYLMHKKFDVLKKSQVYKNKVENQLGRNIKIIKTDYSGEYMFDNFLKQHDIVHHFFMPYFLKQNSVA
jgi:hypothetical protein